MLHSIIEVEFEDFYNQLNKILITLDDFVDFQGIKLLNSKKNLFFE